jgi:hypothetical protein
MTTTTPTIEAKIAKIIYHNLTPLVLKTSTNPILCRLNLHNNSFLKKINHKAKMVYGMSYQPDILVKASYDRGGEDNVENALLTIQGLVRGDHHANHKEYIFKRIEFLVNEAMSALYDRNHEEWMQRIQTAILSAKTTKKPVVKKATPKVKKTTTPKTKKKVIKSKKPVKRIRNKKGQFISTKRRR